MKEKFNELMKYLLGLNPNFYPSAGSEKHQWLSGFIANPLTLAAIMYEWHIQVYMIAFGFFLGIGKELLDIKYKDGGYFSPWDCAYTIWPWVRNAAFITVAFELAGVAKTFFN